jgi:hypothetical protein
MSVKWLRGCLWFFGLLLAAILLGYLAGKPLLMVNCAQGAARSQWPNMTERDGIFTNQDNSRALKLLYLPVRLLPRTDYLVTFTVKNVQGQDPVVLNVDLNGEGYHSDEQKIRIPLPPGTKEKTITAGIYSGEAVPAQAALRLYFSEPNAVSLSGIALRGARKHTRRAFGISVLGSLLIIAGLSWALARRDPAAFPWWRRLSRERKIQSLFVAGFLAVLVAPALQKEFKLPYYPPVEENRTKLEKPAGSMLRRLFLEGADYSKAYEKYFNDQYGFRDLFIRLKNQADYSLFHRSDEVLLGKDNWMEYRRVQAGQLQYAEKYTAQQWVEVYARFEKLRAYLAARGITLVLMPIQQKFSVYPEYFPDGLIARPAPTAFERSLEYFDSHPEFIYIDIRKALLAGKRRYPVFYKTDFHWNSIGAFYGAEETVNTLARLAGKPLRWEHPLQFSWEPGFTGGLNQSLAVLFPPLENQVVIKPTWRERGTFLAPEPPFEVHFRARPGEAPKLLPPTLLIGNSFAYNFIQTGFYEYFSEIYLLHSKQLNVLPQNLPPGIRFVVLQYIEADLGVYFWQDQWWPAYPPGSTTVRLPRTAHPDRRQPL